MCVPFSPDSKGHFQHPVETLGAQVDGMGNVSAKGSKDEFTFEEDTTGASFSFPLLSYPLRCCFKLTHERVSVQTMRSRRHFV